MPRPFFRLFLIRAAALCLLLPFFAPHALAAEEQALTPAQVLAELKAGNERFRAGRSLHPRQDANRRMTTAATGQRPKAMVLACSDARLPVEMIFDQGIGDIFVIRVAGNVTGTGVFGSLEYGLKHLAVPLIIILGHTDCDAIKSLWKGELEESSLGEMLQPAALLIRAIKKNHPRIRDEDGILEATRENVIYSLKAFLDAHAKLAEPLRKGNLRIYGALYNVSGGSVEWLPGDM